MCNGICVEEECEEDPCTLTALEAGLFGGYTLVGLFDNLSSMKAGLLERYLTCQTGTFTENNISTGLRDQMQRELTKLSRKK